ncbi:ArgE/DapE family deacylase [Cupriavidus plantarum]|uniref:ArgE/DapE family deacylase n=1 Tax=Cupriavidus plantarum TaxID=942865 RepID=UPI001B143B09|nr:ArgE/DapE family deacylase [Cupriavidus plantarum]CAG2142043.1 Succinyl-diaminopimelate desuccinylase [Cupriavidus plantarum]SMR65424.1 acetylornithine deacetylase [Cupriavidus plantarum]
MTQSAVATNPATKSATNLTKSSIAEAVRELVPYMVETLSDLVAAPSPSGNEQPAVDVMERALQDLGLPSEHIVLNTAALKDLPLYSPSCCPDGGRYNLLATHRPATRGGRSVLFNGHLDVVPTGPASMWRRDPFAPYVEDGWLFGRGAGDMKAGIVCALAAFKALKALGVQPAGAVGFNAVLEEENTGNGALATVAALRSAVGAGKLASFDTVLIPEPLGEGLMSAQMGVFWMFVELTGRPAHAAYMTTGVNPIEAGIAVMADLRKLEAQWNLPENRPAVYRDHAHPINFNLGQIQGGEWNSSVPCTCTLGVRIGFYPQMNVDDAKAQVAACVRDTVARLASNLTLNIRYEGFHAPGCEFDLDNAPMQALARAHEQVHGTPPARQATTATTDARHFRLTLDTPVTCYGPEARNIHGIDESVSIDSMVRVATTFALFLHDWCGVEPAVD